MISVEVHLNKIEYHEKGQYILSLISESETHILYRFKPPISLWPCSGVMEAQVSLIAVFRSSALLGLVSLIFLLTIGQVSLLANKAQ